MSFLVFLNTFSVMFYFWKHKPCGSFSVNRAETEAKNGIYESVMKEVAW